MKINDIKSFCDVCGSLFDNGRLKKCDNCKRLLTKVGCYVQSFSELKETYTLKLNYQFGEVEQ